MPAVKDVYIPSFPRDSAGNVVMDDVREAREKLLDQHPGLRMSRVQRHPSRRLTLAVIELDPSGR